MADRPACRWARPQAGVDVGGPGGAQVNLPGAADLAAAVPAPVANLASPLLAPG